MIRQTDRAGRQRLGSRRNVCVWIGLLVALSFILAACEYPGITHPQAAQAESSAHTAPPADQPPPAGDDPGDGQAHEPEPDDKPGAEPTPAPTPTPTPEPVPDTAAISLKDFKLDPDSLKVKAGTVTFVLKNEGRYTHDFRVEGQGVDEKAPKVGRGREREWQITLEPGSYQISCPISNHADRGMTGTLEVVP